MYKGLFGYIDMSSKISNLGIANSYIKGNTHVGGIIGENYGITTNNYNKGIVMGNCWVGVISVYIKDGKVSKNYNIGTIKGNQYVGGVVGQIFGKTTSCCYYLNNCATDGVNIVQNGIGNDCMPVDDENGKTTGFNES